MAVQISISSAPDSSLLRGLKCRTAPRLSQSQPSTPIGVKCRARSHSTVVEVIDRPDMTAAAGRLAARLHLSGFHGLDFLLDKTGTAWLIELNPRATQVCHVPAGGGPSLAKVLAATRTGMRGLGP